MPVDIEAVLALLPEMFPGVQPIPLKNIRPNPENPGPALTDQAIQELADNMAERGLVNSVKVQPDKAEPLAGGVQMNPDNPRLTAEGRPWALGDFNFQLLAGERRYRAAGRLGWATLPGFVLNPTAEEAVEITHLDNDVRDRGWWAGYQSIEQLIKANPSLTQRQIGTRLKMDKDKVNRAFRLLPLLNPEARTLIVCNTDNSNKGIRGISEIAASQLAGLGPESTLKPGVKKKEPPAGSLLDPAQANHGPRLEASAQLTQKLWPYPAIPPETQDLVLRTLKAAIEGQMTEAGVKGLVGWIQDGHQPEEFPGLGSAKAKPKKGIAHLAEYKQVSVARIRVNQIVDVNKPFPDEVERKALSMQATGYAPEIEVRTLSEEEKKADPDHDYELFEGDLVLAGAKKLGWPSLNALVYPIDEDEAVRSHFISVRYSFPLTWVEVYAGIEKMLRMEPKNTVAELAVKLEEDPELANQVFPSMKLLNEGARKAISKSVRQCMEGRVDMGGYRFYEGLTVPLARLAGFSENLLETQKLVEEVVNTAIENEIGLDNMEALVEWVLKGNDPADFYEKEA